jgi:hypothetical protein
VEGAPPHSATGRYFRRRLLAAPAVNFADLLALKSAFLLIFSAIPSLPSGQRAGQVAWPRFVP